MFSIEFSISFEISEYIKVGGFPLKQRFEIRNWSEGFICHIIENKKKRELKWVIYIGILIGRMDLFVSNLFLVFSCFMEKNLIDSVFEILTK